MIPTVNLVRHRFNEMSLTDQTYVHYILFLLQKKNKEMKQEQTDHQPNKLPEFLFANEREQKIFFSRTQTVVCMRIIN